MNLEFFSPQIEQFFTGINLFCLVLLTLEFLFAVFFWQLKQYVSNVFYSIFHSIYKEFSYFFEKSSSWLIYEMIKALKIESSIVFNLVFGNNTISSWFSFSLDNWLIILVIAV